MNLAAPSNYLMNIKKEHAHAHVHTLLIQNYIVYLMVPCQTVIS